MRHALAISHVASAIRKATNMSFDDIYIAAHGSLAGQKDEDERNFQKGTLAHKKIAPIHRWIVDNYLPLACKLEPEVFDPSLLTRWSDFVRTHAIYGRFTHRIVGALGLTQRSSKQPIAELPIRATDSFYFELENNLDGMALTLEQADCKIYPFSLHEDQVSVTLPVKTGKQVLPRLAGTDTPDPLSDTDNQGLRCYYVLIATPEIIADCAKGLSNAHPISPEKLDKIALPFKPDDEGKPSVDFELHRLNVVFTK
jgi:hypothetical protein